MTNPNAPAPDAEAQPDISEGTLPCVLVFNASDPSGAGGLASDVTAIASVGAHALPVLTGAYVRDTTETYDFFPMDEDAVVEQARAILEDVPVQAIKVGFAGGPEAISAISELASDYPDVPVIACMPNLSWWDDARIDQYQDAFQELLLPQATVLVGSHNTLWRWLLPDWSGSKSPTPRDIARAAAEKGVPYTLVTGIALPDQFIDNVLASPQSTLGHQKFERIDAAFGGAIDTLSAALAALIADGSDLTEAFTESLQYLDRCLDAGFRPGMGQAVPDRLFWAQADDDDETADGEPGSDSPHPLMEPPFNETRH